MASQFPLTDGKFLVTTGAHGLTAIFSNSSDDLIGGCITVQFTPDVSFAGSFGILCRTPKISTSASTPPFLSMPYRKVYLNGAVGDMSFVSVPITAASLIQIPSIGIQTAFLISCTAGTCQVNYAVVEGATAP